MKQLIFEDPNLAPLPTRIGSAFFTAFFWIIWVYLWMPLITLLLWALGFHYYDDYFLNNSASSLLNLQNVFLLYLAIIVTLGASLLVWARSEYLRFRNVHRRTRPESVQNAELAAFITSDPAVIEALHTQRQITVHHDEHGNFLHATFGGIKLTKQPDSRTRGEEVRNDQG